MSKQSYCTQNHTTGELYKTWKNSDIEHRRYYLVRHEPSSNPNEYDNIEKISGVLNG